MTISISRAAFEEAASSFHFSLDRIEQFGEAMASWTTDDGTGSTALVYHNTDSPWNPTNTPYWEWRSSEGRKTSTELRDLGS
jgi:hypothetical protein